MASSGPGNRRIDKYEILGQIGRGGQGTVYRARDTVLDRIVAIKVESWSALGMVAGCIWGPSSEPSWSLFCGPNRPDPSRETFQSVPLIEW